MSAVRDEDLNRHEALLTRADFIPIPGTKRIKYLQENTAAAHVEFSEEDDKEVRRMFDRVGGAKGTRYPAAFMEDCFGDSPELSALL